jgi:membrane-associated protease RseP (regulator of RpoE activity)
MIYDLGLLGIFVIFISLFLYKQRKNLKKEGLLWLYKTSRGIKLINKIGKKNEKLLNILSYVSIILGFLLMGTMVYLFGKIVWMYIFQSEIVKLVKIPPIMPLLPYLPQIFKLNYLPPFYFIYWIIIIAVVAITHEFSHGIFSVNKKVKIKSTGFGFFPFFLPVFLAAFVELDEKNMRKKKISHQMAILSAGTFANVLTALVGLIILLLFFYLAFTPAGVVFDTYTYSAVGISAITSINNLEVNNISYTQLLSLSNEEGLNEIKTEKSDYLSTKKSLIEQGNNSLYLILYDNAPAIKANISNTILKINGVNLKSKEQLGEELLRYYPGDEILLTVLENGADRDYKIILEESPGNKSLPYLGIGFLNKGGSGILNKLMGFVSSIKDLNVYYKPKFDAAEFIYNLLWWLVMASFSVALVNMLPVGIFDGGRFFYLMVLALTKKEKIAKKAFKFLTYLFLLLLAVIMVFWVISFFK